MLTIIVGWVGSLWGMVTMICLCTHTFVSISIGNHMNSNSILE